MMTCAVMTQWRAERGPVAYSPGRPADVTAEGYAGVARRALDTIPTSVSCRFVTGCVRCAYVSATPPALHRTPSVRLCRSAEGVGFVPTSKLAPPSGFQDRRHRPLGEPSKLRSPGHRGTSTADADIGPAVASTGQPLAARPAQPLIYRRCQARPR